MANVSICSKYLFTGIGTARTGTYRLAMRSREQILQKPDFQTRLADAIAQQSIQAFFQPIVDAKTHRVVSAEVVPCWHDEIHGHAMPHTFLPVAQQMGLLEDLGLQVWAKALACLRAWRSHGTSITLVANVSRQQLHAKTFTTQMSDDLNQFGIPLSCIDLEIAESVAAEMGSSTLHRMAELRAAGFGVMIGELGSGHSTFSQLLGNPATGIRIDAALTRRVQGKVGAELIETIVKLAQACNLQTTATGVEDAETAALVTLLGVQRMQGRYFGQPMEWRTFEKVLEQDRHAR